MHPSVAWAAHLAGFCASVGHVARIFLTFPILGPLSAVLDFIRSKISLGVEETKEKGNNTGACYYSRASSVKVLAGIRQTGSNLFQLFNQLCCVLIHIAAFSSKFLCGQAFHAMPFTKCLVEGDHNFYSKEIS